MRMCAVLLLALAGRTGAARFDEYNTTDDTLSDLVRAGSGRA